MVFRCDLHQSLSLCLKSNWYHHVRHSPEVKPVQAGISQIIVGPLMNVSLCSYFVVI